LRSNRRFLKTRQSEGSDAAETTAHVTEQAEETVDETQEKDQEAPTELKRETGAAAEGAKDKITGDSSTASDGQETHDIRNPAERDPNTTSGKQEGVSNADTAHVVSVSLLKVKVRS
jgi:hypothetical protein